jgi:hypothetical protein
MWFLLRTTPAPEKPIPEDNTLVKADERKGTTQQQGIAQPPTADKKDQAKETTLPAKSIQLIGTTWNCKGYWNGGADLYIKFASGGKLLFKNNERTFWRSTGTWQLEGHVVYHKMLHEFKGTVQGDVIVGETWSKDGRRWPNTFQRVP